MLTLMAAALLADYVCPRATVGGVCMPQIRIYTVKAGFVS